MLAAHIRPSSLDLPPILPACLSTHATSPLGCGISNSPSEADLLLPLKAVPPVLTLYLTPVSYFLSDFMSLKLIDQVTTPCSLLGFYCLLLLCLCFLLPILLVCRISASLVSTSLSLWSILMIRCGLFLRDPSTPCHRTCWCEILLCSILITYIVTKSSYIVIDNLMLKIKAGLIA